MIKGIFICREKFLGKCEKECTPDFNTNHHPNNYDCPNFTERIKMYQFEVREK